MLDREIADPSELTPTSETAARAGADRPTPTLVANTVTASIKRRAGCRLKRRRGRASNIVLLARAEDLPGQTLEIVARAAEVRPGWSCALADDPMAARTERPEGLRLRYGKGPPQAFVRMGPDHRSHASGPRPRSGNDRCLETEGATPWLPRPA